jgi:hypothetical protein
VPGQRPRPQSQLAFSAYTPPLKYPTPSAAGSEQEVNGGTGSATLSDDALWKALGGGRFAAKNGAGVVIRVNDMSHHQQQHSQAGSQSHPDYPQMSPYDDQNDNRIALGLVGRRPVSMAPAVGAVNGPFVAQLE